MSSTSSSTEWKPPAKIEELYAHTNGNQFSSINKPTAGARDDVALPVGNAAIQLYSLATPNGQKTAILLEELVELKVLEYDAHVINIGKGEQFSGGFVAVNPNSKIPALVDKQGPDGKDIYLWESASINLYLAEKYKKFTFDDVRLRAEQMNWIFWQMGGQGPMTGNFGHFFVYAPADKGAARDYGVARYGMEVQRLCDVLDKHLATRTYLVGEQYSLADIIVFPWFHAFTKFYKHSSGVSGADFLSIDKYANVQAWAKRINERPAVQRGLQVCSFDGVPKPWLSDKKEGTSFTLGK